MDTVWLMRSRRGAAACALLLCTLHLACGQSTSTLPLPVSSVPSLTDSNEALVAKLMRVPAPELTVHPGDLLSVQILEIEKFDYKVRVATDGTVSLPLIETIPVADKSTAASSAFIRERLETLGMVHDPHIYVGVLEQPSQVVTVAGEVENPDIFLAPSVRTLMGAISKAGGLKSTASSNVTLIRPGAEAVYSIQLGSVGGNTVAGSIPVYSGDTIVVNKIGVIYVVGAVKLSGSYPLKNNSPTTAAQAMALAGNAGFEADLKHSRIVRRLVNGTTAEIPVDLRRRDRGSEHDPILRSDDILFVPSTSMKALLKGGGAGIAVSLASAAIYRF